MAGKDIFGKPVFTYTSQQAEDDGILFDITRINPAWKKGLFNYVTTNLLSKGYLDKGKKDTDLDYELNIPNILDLLNQANELVRKTRENFTMPDTFFSGEIEFPDGNKREIFIQQNETGKFTIMLPEDY